MKKVLWFIFILLFVGNCIITVSNYRNINLINIDRDIALTNKAIIKELIKKIVSDDEALKDSK